jgi:hypothetical protein
MITRRTFSFAIAAAIGPGFTAAPAAAQTSATAAALLDAAEAQAASGQQSIFAIFHASW